MSLGVIFMVYQVLARKWRPNQFDQVVGQPHIVQALQNALEKQYLHHAYLFTGTRGVGKTTIARLLAKCLNCEKSITAVPCGQCGSCREIEAGRFIDLFEVDAASRTKVEDTRELLENVPYAPSKGRFKVYLIDEVHMLSGHSFNALLKTLEEPPSHVKFLLATTDPQKLPPTVLSRCLQFHLLAMSPDKIQCYLEKVLTLENIPYEIKALTLISQAANGSMRDALSLLDQSIAYGNGSVLYSNTSTMLGTIDQKLLIEILKGLKGQDGGLIFEAIKKMAELGMDFGRALAELLTIFHHIAIHQVVPDSSNFLLPLELSDFSHQFVPEQIQLYYQIGLIGQRDLPFAPTSKIGFEMTLLRMLAFLPEHGRSANEIIPTTQNNKTPSPESIPVGFQEAGEARAPSRSGAYIEYVSSEQQSQNLKGDGYKLLSQSFLRTEIDNEEKKSLPILEAAKWMEILPHLKLQGGTLLLAQQCEMQVVENECIILFLHKKHQPLYQVKHLEKIKSSLVQHFGKELSVEIKIVDAAIQTPAIVSVLEEKKKDQSKKQLIENDPFVQALKKTFDAILI